MNKKKDALIPTRMATGLHASVDDLPSPIKGSIGSSGVLMNAAVLFQ